MSRPDWCACVFGVALVLSFAAALHRPAHAATIVVSGGCSLIDAITAANTDSSTGGCSAGSGADRLVLNTDVNLTAVDNNVPDANGLPVITTEIVIAGSARRIRRATGSPPLSDLPCCQQR